MSIYFIRSGENGPIKIGYTDGDVLVRLASLQTGNPVELTLIKTIAGSRKAERHIHSHFEEIHHRGEWYHPTSELLEFITKGHYKTPAKEKTPEHHIGHYVIVVDALKAELDKRNDCTCHHIMMKLTELIKTARNLSTNRRWYVFDEMNQQIGFVQDHLTNNKQKWTKHQKPIETKPKQKTHDRSSPGRKIPPFEVNRYLRKLLAGKTSGINDHVAKMLEKEGLAVLGEKETRSNAIKVTLTESGRRLAMFVELEYRNKIKHIQIANNRQGANP